MVRLHYTAALSTLSASHLHSIKHARCSGCHSPVDKYRQTTGLCFFCCFFSPRLLLLNLTPVKNDKGGKNSTTVLNICNLHSRLPLCVTGCADTNFMLELGYTRG